MNKQPRKTHRLGSFEQLESRALLASAGMPQGMMHETEYDRASDLSRDFSRGPRMEMSSRDFAVNNDRGPRNDFRGEAQFPQQNSSAGYDAIDYSSSNYQVTATVTIFVVTVPPAPAVSQPTYFEPLVHAPQAQSSFAQSSVQSPPTSFVSALASPSSDLDNRIVAPPAPPPTANVVNRAPSSFNAERNSLSILSGLAVGLVTPRDTDSSESSDSETPTASPTKEREQREEESQVLPRQTTDNATNLEQRDTDEDKDLIELNSEELLKRTKRKATPANAANHEALRIRDIATQTDRLSLRRLELPAAEHTWSGEVAETAPLPVNDDLIELLTNDQVEQTANGEHRATPFAAAPAQLEANLGYYQAIEATPSPGPEVPAAVAAAALPAREAQ
ncbi:hypothetical protein [Anatilimnocola floriformis]|uniref:hypothetical protein n=1 Tax=Anatilimnocola floriformis TaxID=2948575 RepID=UPI0020C4ED31|nr:hypothetical protein [Anatilimnocola floriformis]